MLMHDRVGTIIVSGCFVHVYSTSHLLVLQASIPQSDAKPATASVALGINADNERPF